MGRFKTFTNNGLLTPNDINTLASEIDTAMLPWRTIRSGGAFSKAATGWRPSTGHILVPGLLVLLGSKFLPVVISGGTWSAGGGSGPGYSTTTGLNLGYYHWMVYIDPQSYGVRTGRLRWRIQLSPNATAYGANLTFALYGVYGITQGQSGSQGWPHMTGSATAQPGSAFTVAPPAPSSAGSLSFSNVMAMPKAGHYAMGVSANTTPTLASEMVIRADLQFRPEDLS